MKNIFKYSLTLLTVLLGFTACSDSDDNYQPASISGPQVFFDKDLTTTVNLTFDDTSFKVPVSRGNAAEAVTVNLTKVDEENLFNVPASVTFNAGETEAEIEIGLDPTQFEYNEFKPLTISVDPTVGTPYGIGTVSLSVGMPLTYKSLGTGTYVDNWFEHTTQVDIEQCEQNPNIFRIAAPYKDYDGDDYFHMSGEMGEYLEFQVLQPGDVFNDVTITESGLVVFPIYSTGAIHPSYTDDVIVMLHPSEYSSMAADQSKWAFNKVAEYAADGTTPARIQLAPSYYMMKYGGWNYTQEDGVVEIYFPGNDPKDYDVAVEYTGKYIDTADNYFAMFNVTVGEDLDEVKYAMVKSDDVNSVISGIIDGSIESTSITASGQFTAPLTEDGTYYIVAVGYAEGEPQAYDYAKFKFETTPSAWESLGTGLFTDDILISNYKGSDGNYLAPITYEVEIQQNKEKPGLYRLVNPYGEPYPYNEEGDWDASRDWFIEIDATDPDAVTFEAQETGLDWGDGMVSIQSIGDYFVNAGKSFADVKAAGYFGKLADGVITFPVKGILITWGEDGPYYTNANGATSIVLPSAVTAAAKRSAVRRAATNHAAHKTARGQKVNKLRMAQMKPVMKK
ncbi:MAG: hypothetical protein IJ527_09855 [Prevotella sp.]|nr:hypothetical protein [Prevotella sp.]